VRKKAQERSRQWALENPERAKVSRRNAKVKRRNLGTEGFHTADDIAEILKMQRGKCAYCRIKMGDKYTVDHIIPVAKGGTNDRRNIQLTCMPCNREKWARDPLFHAQMLGRLI
jgi:5-methylcytosine-specific restriction endonuclease McrA